MYRDLQIFISRIHTECSPYSYRQDLCKCSGCLMARINIKFYSGLRADTMYRLISLWAESEDSNISKCTNAF